MLGAIIGDIAGSRYEFNPTNDYHFEMFSKEAGYTDDTICTCAIADALLNKQDLLIISSPSFRTNCRCIIEQAGLWREAP